MCGIAGILSRADYKPANALKIMLGAVRHRGPDQFGVYEFQSERASVGLGNARLSIIDLAGGQQPISNENGGKWIVYNGEVFNYVELRRRLAALGHRFHTQGDTEAIVHLYEEYGPECLKHLNGQFAFAIWDERREELFLARDRLGVRPLFYTVQDGRFAFASEIKAILPHAGAARLDPASLAQIFTFWSTAAPRTAFSGIYTLPPGHCMVVRPGRTPESELEIRIRRYWQMQFPPEGKEPYGDLNWAAGRLRRLLTEAVALRLRADVPVGAYLSGGLDSAAITALARRCARNRLEMFSIAFSDAAFDESEHQQHMARHLGTRHHVVACTPGDIGRVFPDMVRHAETPLLRTAPAPLYLLSRLVREHGLKVVLTGEGADEFLGGYNIFKEAKIRRFWARRPDSTKRPKLLGELYRYIGNMPNAAFLRKFFGQGLDDVNDPCYSHAVRWRNTARTMRFFSPSLHGEIDKAHANSSKDAEPGEAWADALQLPAGFMSWSPLARAQYIEAAVFLPEYLLSSQGDRMAMANSVEGRFPFLDHNVVEFCNRLAPRLKLNGLEEKFILKRAVADLLPESICTRHKQPYRAPIQASFFPGGRPLDWVAEVLSSAALNAYGYFDAAAVAALAKKAAAGAPLGETDNMALAGILSTQLLHRQFIEDFRPAPPLDENDDVKYVARGSTRRPGRDPATASV